MKTFLLALSLYVVLVQAMKNELQKGFAKNDNEFDRVFGSTASTAVMDMISCRFNLDEIDPTGRKVGLLDRHHLWAFLVDPMNHSLRSTFLPQAPMAALLKEMVMKLIFLWIRMVPILHAVE